jgi:hypothetical protein
VRRSFAIGLVGLALISAAVVPSRAASSAPTNTLRIVTLDRHGDPLQTQAQVTNVRTLRNYTMLTNRTRSLPAGTYLILVDIYGAPDYTDTLGAKQVTVSGNSTVAFRARFGRPVRAFMHPALPSGYSLRLNFDLDSSRSLGSVSGYAYRGNLFVLPSHAPSVELAVGAVWQRRVGTGDRYLAAALHQHGIPNGMTRVFRRSALTTIEIKARGGPLRGRPTVALQGSVESNALASVLQLNSDVQLPGTMISHVPPGRWEIWEDKGGAGDFLSSRPRPYLAGRQYTVRINRAVWGPSRLPYRWSGGRVYVGTVAMFTDPTLRNAGPHFYVKCVLRHNGRTIVSRTVSDEGVTLNPVIREAGWYTLTQSAWRRTSTLFAGALSPRDELKVHYYDDLTPYRQFRGYLTEFLPTDLDARNQASGNADTRVALRIFRGPPGDGEVRLPADTVRTVTAWWSSNHGRSWHPAAVTHRSGSWSMVVPNPAVGAVSLRAKVFDTHGGWARTTVIDGYAIG